jgi:hypothetical protein
MAKRKKPDKWFFAVNCPCGRINVIAVAPSSRASVSGERSVLCNACGKRTTYPPSEVWLTQKGSK